MVVLGTRDVAGLRRFYADLGWTEHPGASDQLVMFSLGDTVLTLHADDAASAPRPASAPPPAVTLVIDLETAEAVDGAVAVATGAGGSLESAPTDQPWGGRSAVVADPEGNRWELLFVPGRRSAADSS
jgi:uncharacterized glyoxalase superfamily protein PhnB